MNMIDEKTRISAKNKFTLYLKSKNMRNTQERFTILDKIFSLNNHFDVETLYNMLEEDCYHVSKATIYNTIELLEESTALRDKVHENAAYFRAKMEEAGFDLLPGVHPIVPVMLYDPKVAQAFAKRMLDKGVYVVGFCYPVVPKGKDRIRTQISAGHSREDLDRAVKAFKEVKDEMGI